MKSHLSAVATSHIPLPSTPRRCHTDKGLSLFPTSVRSVDIDSSRRHCPGQASGLAIPATSGGHFRPIFRPWPCTRPCLVFTKGPCCTCLLVLETRGCSYRPVKHLFVSKETSYHSFACDPCLPRLMLPSVRIPFAKPLRCYMSTCISQ
jgi:hypothetical protein